MNGNEFGRLFRVTTYGESHGPAMGCTVSGVPAGVELDEDDGGSSNSEEEELEEVADVEEATDETIEADGVQASEPAIKPDVHEEEKRLAA